MKYFILILSLIFISCGSVDPQFDQSDLQISFDPEKVSAQGYEEFGASICNYSQKRVESFSASVSEPIEIVSVPIVLDPMQCDSIKMIAKIENRSNFTVHSLVLNAVVNGESYRYESEFKMEITSCGVCLLWQ